MLLKSDEYRYPCPFVYFLGHTLQSGPGPAPGSLEKADPGPLEKADPIPKFTVRFKDSFQTNLRVLVSNMTIVFQNSSPKIPK